MDPLTHGLAGAAAAQLASGKDKIRAASFAGFSAALLPDIEFFIRIPSDPLFQLEIHRQFTHSLLFIPAGALLATFLLWWFLRRFLSFREIYFFSLLGFATHGLVDAATSYGTELLWPFSDIRFAWNLLPIVHPVMTVMMALLTGIAFYYRNRLGGWIAMGWILLFLLAGYIQRERGLNAVERLAAERNHAIQQVVVKPTIGNLILWRSTYIAGDTIHVDAVRSGIFTSPRVLEGGRSPLVVPERDFAEWKGSVLYNDILRFQRFSDGYLIRHPEKAHIIGDGRYSMLPTGLIPLWGIHPDTTQPGRHTDFQTFRDTSPELREQFWNQLTGKP